MRKPRAWAGIFAGAVSGLTIAYTRGDFNQPISLPGWGDVAFFAAMVGGLVFATVLLVRLWGWLVGR